MLPLFLARIPRSLLCRNFDFSLEWLFCVRLCKFIVPMRLCPGPYMHFLPLLYTWPLTSVVVSVAQWQILKWIWHLWKEATACQFQTLVALWGYASEWQGLLRLAFSFLHCPAKQCHRLLCWSICSIFHLCSPPLWRRLSWLSPHPKGAGPPHSTRVRGDWYMVLDGQGIALLCTDSRVTQWNRRDLWVFLAPRCHPRY